MTTWLEDASANRHIKTYVKDFLDISGNFTVRNNEDYKWNSYGQVLSGPYESDGIVNYGITVDMDASGTTIAVGGNQEDSITSGDNDGAARVYRYDSDAEVWYQLGNKLVGDSTLNVSNFGWQGIFLSDDGTIVAVNDYGSPSSSGLGTAGKIYVFQYNADTNNWDNYGDNQTELEGTSATQELGGRGVSMSGDGSTIAAAEKLNDHSVRIKKLVNGSWTSIGDTGVVGAANYDHARPSLNYDGSRVVFNDFSNQLAYVYEYSGSGTTWTQVGSAISNSGGNSYSSYTSMNKAGDIVAVHEETNDTVRIYQFVDTDWVQLGSTLSNSNGSGGSFGRKMRINAAGDMIFASDFENDTINIFKYQNYDWVQIGDPIIGIADSDFSRGCGISDDGTKIVAGGYLADLNGTNAGYVQAFQWSTKSYGPLIDISGETIIFGKDVHKDDPNYYKVVEDGINSSVYGVTNELVGVTNDYFGSSLAMNEDGSRMIVGAALGDETATDDGYAMILEWNNGRWGQIGNIISPTSTNYYRTGVTVDMNDAGDIVLVGALRGNDNNQTGSISAYEYINGDWSIKGSEINGSSSSDKFGHESCAMNGIGNVIAGIDIVGNVKVYQYVEANSDWSQLGSTISVSSGETNSGYAATKRIDLNQDGTIIVVGDVNDDTTGTNNGRLSVYKFTGDVTDGSWNLIGNHITITTSSSFPQDDNFGREVSINSDGTIVGGTSIFYNSEEGRSFIYKYSEDAGDWAQLGTDIGRDQMVDSSTTYNARSIALSGDGKTVTIGDSHDSTLHTDGGAVNVFKYANGNWVWVGKIYGSQSSGYFRISCISRDGKRFAGSTLSDDSGGTDSGIVKTGTIVNFLEGAAMTIEHDRVRVPKLSMGDWTTTPISMDRGDLTTPMMTLTGLPSNERDYSKEWEFVNANTEGFNSQLWSSTKNNGHKHASYFYLDDNKYSEHDLLFRGFEFRSVSDHNMYVREGYALVSRYKSSSMFFQTNSTQQNQSIPNKKLSLGIGTVPGWYVLNVNGNASASSWAGSSDDRLKHNERLITNGLETIRKLAPRHYYKTRKMYDADHNFDLDASGNPLDASGNALAATDYNIETGFIAQEVKEIPELTHVFKESEDDKPHGLQYTCIFVHAIKALQELDEKVQQRQAIITSLEEKIQTLENA